MNTIDQRPAKAAGVRVARKLSLPLVAGLIAILAFGPVTQLPDSTPTRAAGPVAEATLPPLSTAAAASVAPAPTVAASPGALAEPTPAPLPSAATWAVDISREDLAPPPRAAVVAPAASAEPEPSAKPTPKPTPKPKASPKPAAKASPKPETKAKPAPTPTPKPSTTTYTGTSRLWYPALGINAKWSWWGCDYGGGPEGLGPGVYRWGCGPKNNIYLMSHAWSTFKAIQRGYHSGAMKVGQSVWYANKNSNVSQWKVKWIKRVKIDYFNATYSEWATNDSPTPIMTFQTCDGSKNQYRIIVRLVPTK